MNLLHAGPQQTPFNQQVVLASKEANYKEHGLFEHLYKSLAYVYKTDRSVVNYHINQVFTLNVP
jgi:hypothetical protein